MPDMSMLITDQLNNSINIAFPPKRIVSLVPSQTELLYDLGLNKEVTGITKFCIHPQIWFRNKQRIGGTKTVNIDLVKKLQPDLIIANKEENEKAQIEELRQIAPVYVSDIRTLEEALEMITAIGKLVDKKQRAIELVSQIEKAFQHLTPLNHQLTAAYLIWKNPYMAAGGDTFINSMLSKCGFINMFQNLHRYPEIQISNLSTDYLKLPSEPLSVNRPLPPLKNCQLLLLSSEPYPFKQKHVDELQTLLPSTKIMLVDGEMFSWYGSRLLHAAKYFKKLIEQIQG